MIDSLYYSSRKVKGRCENSCELQNKLPKALWFNEANHERIELTHFIHRYKQIEKETYSQTGGLSCLKPP